MTILIGFGILIFGLYLYRKDIYRDEVGLHKFNAIWKYKSYIFIYALIVVGVIIIIRELIIWSID